MSKFKNGDVLLNSADNLCLVVGVDTSHKIGEKLNQDQIGVWLTLNFGDDEIYSTVATNFVSPDQLTIKKVLFNMYDLIGETT